MIRSQTICEEWFDHRPGSLALFMRMSCRTQSAETVIPLAFNWRRISAGFKSPAVILATSAAPSGYTGILGFAASVLFLVLLHFGLGVPFN